MKDIDIRKANVQAMSEAWLAVTVNGMDCILYQHNKESYVEHISKSFPACIFIFVFLQYPHMAANVVMVMFSILKSLNVMLMLQKDLGFG